MLKSVRTVLTIFVFGCILFAASEASAQILTFDEMDPDPFQGPILGSVTCSAGTGFRFSSDHFHVIDATYGEVFSNSGTTHLGYESGRGFPVRLDREGTGTFSLLSLDAGEFYSAPDPDRPDAEHVLLTGFRADGSVVTHTIDLDGIRDGAGGAPDFQHFLLPATFVNLRTVVFTGLRQGNVSGGMAFDNLEYQLDPAETLPPCTFEVLPSDLPTVSFVGDYAGVLAGTIPLEAVATDNTGIASVVFRLDGVELASPDQTAPYTLQWDTTAFADGPHTLTADATDDTGNVGTASLTVTIQNGIVVSSGPHYVALDGVNDYVRAPDRPALSFGNGTTDTPFTLEMWLRPSAANDRYALLEKAGEYRLRFIYGTLMVELLDDSSHSTASVVTNSVNFAALVGAWHHLAVTYDGRGGAAAANGIAVYLDGAPVGVFRSTDAGYAAMENRTTPLTFGRGDDSINAFNGGLDELRLWNVQRTQSALQFSMFSELLGTEPGLVAYWRFNEGSGWAVEDDSPGNASIVLLNGTQWAPDGPFAPDTTPPTLGNIATSNLTASSVTVTFTTNEMATGWVTYSVGTACPCTDVYSAAPGTTHSVVLTGLAADTVYQITVKAQDAANNMQAAAPFTIRTLVVSSDTQAPQVTLVSPASGPVAGQVAIEATASDDVGVVNVVFRLDNQPLGAPVVTAPYTLTWDTTTVADGAHTLTAEARDAAGNVGTTSLAVQVQNTPVELTPHHVTFDGVDDNVRVADAAALSFGNGTIDTPFTLEMWVRPDQVQGRHQLLGKSSEYRVAIIYGTLMINLVDASTNSAAEASTIGVDLSALAGTWHHLAVTYDGRGGSTAANGITAYLDGTALALFRSTAGGYVAMENLTGPLAIGHESDQWNQFAGAMDEVRVWNIARTPAELAATRSTELAGTEPGLVAYWRFNEGSGLTSTDDSPGSLVATLLSTAMWAVDGPLAPDTTAPQISNVATSNLTASGVTVTFTTNEITTGWITYSVGTACPCTDVFSAGQGTTHSVVLTGLAADTVHQLTAKAHDAADNQQAGAPFTIRTLVASSDTQAPQVTLVSPAAGPVAGQVTIEVTATDNVGVANVVFRLDGQALGAPVVTAPYTLTWDTTTVADGAHTLIAEARDAAGNVGTATVTVQVQNTAVELTPHFVTFDGVDDNVRVADAPALSFGNGTIDTPFTLEMWVRPDQVNGRHQLIGKSSEYRVAIIYGTLMVNLVDESSHSQAEVSTIGVDLSALAGTWHHLAVTYDGRGGAAAADGITVYLDGTALSVLRSTGAGYVAMENLTGPLAIGHESDQWNQFAGALDEVRLWNIARTPAQLAATRNIELAGTEPGLVAYWRFNEGSGLTSTDDSPGSHGATLLSAAMWAAEGPLAPDTTAPTLANIATSNLTASGVTVTFTTNEMTTGWVTDSVGTACPCTDVFSAGPGTTHSVVLTGLAADTVYQITPKAHDAANNEQAAAPFIIRTLVVSSDTQAPQVTLVSPASGPVAGQVTLDATASDNVGVVSVTFRLDDQPLGAPVVTAPYTLTWDSTTVADGAHTLTAEARDAAGNVGAALVTVQVQNTPVELTPHFVTFDGVDDNVRVADAAALSFGNGTLDTPFTLETWLRPDQVNGRHQLLGKSSEYRVAIIYGTLMVNLVDESTHSGAEVSTFSVDLSALVGTWHHLAVTYDGRGGAAAADGITVYLDGTALPVFRSTGAGYVAMENLTAPLSVGHESDQWNQFAGALDEVRVWNILRTPAELAATRNSELAGTEPGLVAYWRFNEGSGLTSTDDSPASNGATLATATMWAPNGPLAPAP